MRATRSWMVTATAVMLGTAAVGCAPAGVRANLETPVTGPPGALACPTLTLPSDSGQIGPAGGRIGAGGHMLVVPVGALSETRRFTMVHPARDYVVVSLEPHGQPFEIPATLSLSYEHCAPPERALAVYRWTPGTGWTRLESRQDTRRSVVEVELQSLSSYALGAE